MSAKRLSLHRGLLAGLLTLITFASGAVAMTARGTGTAAGVTPVVQADQGTVFAVGDHDGGGGGREQAGNRRGRGR